MRLTHLLLLLSACSSKGGDTAVRMGADGFHSDGPWQLVTDEVPGGVLLSAWSSGDTLHAVGGDLGGGGGVMVHGNRNALCVEEGVTERALWWIHGQGDTDWTAVGEAGTVLQETNGVRNRLDVPTEATLFGVWVSGTEIWAAGGHVGSGENRGEIWLHDGNEWSPVAVDLPHVLFKVWEDWFVGQDIAYRWTGTELVEYPIDGRLLTASGTGPDDMWAVGGLASALVLRWDGERFNEVDTAGLGQVINGVYTAPGEDVWVAGNYGVTARWTGSGWEQPSFPLTSDHLHAVWRHDGETWWFGGDLFNTGDNHGTIIRYTDDANRPEVSPCE